MFYFTWEGRKKTQEWCYLMKRIEQRRSWNVMHRKVEAIREEIAPNTKWIITTGHTCIWTYVVGLVHTLARIHECILLVVSCCIKLIGDGMWFVSENQPFNQGTSPAVATCPYNRLVEPLGSGSNWSTNINTSWESVHNSCNWLFFKMARSCTIKKHYYATSVAHSYIRCTVVLELQI